jgi:hypothetical protein
VINDIVNAFLGLANLLSPARLDMHGSTGIKNPAGAGPDMRRNKFLKGGIAIR